MVPDVLIKLQNGTNLQKLYTLNTKSVYDENVIDTNYDFESREMFVES